jgi:hypothetical protein
MELHNNMFIYSSYTKSEQLMSAFLTECTFSSIRIEMHPITGESLPWIGLYHTEG